MKKIKAEIERLLKCTEPHRGEAVADGSRQTLYWIKDFITSLQQEQPKFRIGDTIHEKGENTVFPMTIERISDGDYVCDGGKCFVSIKFQDNYELIQQEQPEVDLDFQVFANVEGKETIVETGGIKGNLEEIPSNVDLEKEIELTWEDIRDIIRIAEGLRNENEIFGYPFFYKEILKRFSKLKKK